MSDPLTSSQTSARLQLTKSANLDDEHLPDARKSQHTGYPGIVPSLVAVVVLIAGACAPAPHVEPSQTLTTGLFSTARLGHTSTILSDGRILIAGGVHSPSGPAALATAGIYDATTGAFVSTSPMGVIRTGHAAALMTDGDVLIVGGDGYKDQRSLPLASAELYRPITGTFAPTGSMESPRVGPAAVALPDGRVLVLGGADTTRALASAELYDPKTGTFTPTAGPMTTPRFAPTATLLNDGRVLVTGGMDSPFPSGQVLASAELFDPTTRQFKLAGAMTTGREGHTAILLQDGRVLIVGGAGEASSIPWAEVFDANSSTFSLSGSMSTPRLFGSAALLRDGRVLVLGGDRTLADKGLDASLASAELFDPSTGQFVLTGTMSVTRESPTVNTLSDGQVLVVGGGRLTPTGRAPASAELYDPKSGTFRPATTGATAGILVEGRRSKR